MGADHPRRNGGAPRSGPEDPAGPRGRWRDADDGELVRAARRGDNVAFDEIVGRHMRRAFGLAYRLTGHREDAEDLVQEAFVAAYEALGRFDTGRPFAPWLLRIVYTRGLNLNEARSLRRTEPIPETVRANGASPLESAERSELAGRIAGALATLPERRRLIVQMFDADGFSGREISEILDVPEGTVRWELHEARAALRAALEPSVKGSG